MNNNVNFNGFIDPYQEGESPEATNGAATNTAHIAPPYRPGVLFDIADERDIEVSE